MKIIRIILLFIIFLGLKSFAAQQYILKEHDPMNLIGDKSIVQNYYNHNGTNLYYSETYINQDKKGPAAAILVIHSGKERSNNQTLKHLTFPGLQSLIKYAKRHNIKVLIIAPQYPTAISKENKKIPKNYNDASLQLLKNRVSYYNIPNDRIFILGASIGSTAVNDILNENSNYFAKAVIVSSNFSVINFTSDNLKTQIYAIQGEYDTDNKHKFEKNIKEKHLNAKFVMIKKVNHDQTLESSVGYPNYMWKWLFQQKKMHFWQLIKSYCKQFELKLKNLFNR